MTSTPSRHRPGQETDHRIGPALSAMAARRGRAVAVRHGSEVVTYAELDELTRRTAGALRAMGVGPGERVCVLSRSPIAVLTVVVAAIRAGAVAVPLNWRLSTEQVAGVIDDASAPLLVLDASVEHARAELAGGPARVVELATDPGAGRFAGLVAATSSIPGDAGAGPEDAVVQIYTSGTSGEPKGVVLTGGNLACKVRGMVAAWGFTESSVSLLATPLFHIGGLSWALVGLAAGATLVVPESVSGPALEATIAELGVSHAFLVPKLLADLVREVTAKPDGAGSAASLDVVLCGAAPVGVELQQRAVEALGCRLLQVYGLTETTGSITQLDVAAVLAGSDGAQALRSSGEPLPWVEVEIRATDGATPLPRGEHGEIWTRSPQNCAGYWRRPEATAALSSGGWLRTGDGGFLDAAGRLHVTDRLKDMIISGGENIYSVEVERAVLQLPAVRDVAVVGRPDDEWGESVVAVVELHEGHHLDTATVADHVGRVLGGYKRPRDLVVVESLPRNASGKVLKREVRDLVADPIRGV